MSWFSKPADYISEADQLLEKIRQKGLHHTAGRDNKRDYYRAMCVKRDQRGR